MTRLSRSRVAVATGLTLGTAATSLAFATVASATDLAAPVAPASVVAGAEFTVTGTGCSTIEADYPAYAVVLTDATTETDDIAIGEVDANGAWSVTLSFPDDVVLGAHELGALCDNSYAGEPHEYPIVGITVTAGDTEGDTEDDDDTDTDDDTDEDTDEDVDDETDDTDTVSGAIRGTAAITAGISGSSAATTAAAPAVPGQQITKILKGFKPGEKVTVVLHSTPQVLGTFTADANGVVTATFTVPAGTVVGDHTLVFEGDQGSYYQETFTVAASTPVKTASSGLAYTGADVAVPLAIGGALVLAGGGALLVSRRRNAAEATQA